MKRKGKPPRLAETFLGTGSRRGLRRVFLGGDGGARQAGPGGPSSVGIVRWSDLPPPPFFFFFAGAVSLLASVSGLFWCGTLFSVPSQSQFMGGKCARWFFVRFQCGPPDGTEANLAPCQRSDVSIAAG